MSNYRAFRQTAAVFAGFVLASISALILSLVPVQAQDKVETFTGYLIDKSCAAAIKHDHNDPTQRLKDHTRTCSLEPACCEAGYTVYAAGKWIDLDAASSEMAQKIIKASKKSKSHMCKITGVFKRNEFHASSLSEVN
jgi:hypothetical protein